jgi:hypothetical protein
MSTTEITPVVENTGIQELPIVQEKRTYCRVGFHSTVTDPKTNEESTEYSAKVMSEADAKEAVDSFTKAKTEGKKVDYDKVEIELTQTFGFDHGHTVDALVEIFGGNVKELCKQTNNAVDVKLGNRVRSLLLATNEDGSEYTFQPAEGVYDLRQYIGEETASRGKSDFEKAKAIAGKLSPEQRAALMALLDQ